MSASVDELRAAAETLRVETIRAVVRFLEQREPLNVLDIPYGDGLADRLRALRGKLHHCDPNEWGPLAPQTQEAAPAGRASSVPDVHARRTKAKERQGSVARARPAKTRRVRGV